LGTPDILSAAPMPLLMLIALTPPADTSDDAADADPLASTGDSIDAALTSVDAPPNTPPVALSAVGAAADDPTDRSRSMLDDDTRDRADGPNGGRL